MIPCSRQAISDEEINAVVDVLRSDFLTQGQRVTDFERALANHCDVAHAVAVCNGTAALHLACRVLGLTAGDALWTSPITFVASATCASFCGAAVDFVDIHPQTRNIDIDKLEQKLIQAREQRRLPKVLVAVHFAGLSCDMAAIARLAREFQFAVIEDAAHAIGGRYLQQPIGSCRYSDMTVFSFHPVKNITAGEGGAITCRDETVAEQLRQLRHHGLVRDAAQWQYAPDGPSYYEQQQLGYNYRITDIQAAIATVQLQKLPAFVAERQRQVQVYNQAFADLPVRLPHSDADTAWHLYVIELPSCEVRHALFDYLAEQGIGSNIHYRPVYRQPYFREQGFAEGYCPKAERYAECTLSLPLFVGLTAADQQRVITAVCEFLQREGAV